MSSTAVVTGATGGIGQAVVSALTASGYRVYAVGRGADTLVTMQNGNVVACTADLSRLESLPTLSKTSSKCTHSSTPGFSLIGGTGIEKRGPFSAVPFRPSEQHHDP